MSKKSIIRLINIFFIYYVTIGNYISSQTYISPVIGFDFQKVVPYEKERIKFKKNGYSHVNPNIGIKFEQKIYNSLMFNYMGKFAYNKIIAIVDESLLDEKLIFRYYYNENSIGIGYLWKQRIHLYVARTYSFIHQMKIFDLVSNKYTYPPPILIMEKGFKISSGFKYKKIDLGFYYYSRTYTDPIKKSYYHRLKSITSLGLELSYNFKILNAIKLKKNDRCPDFKSNK